MKNIVVNFESETIELTKNFSKRAGVVGSPEYRTLVEVKREFPDYTLCIKPTHSHYTPSPYSRLTYADMEATIMRCDDANKREVWLDEFNRRRCIFPFPQIKSWFVQNVLAETTEYQEIA
jgi:hypothetical protein